MTGALGGVGFWFVVLSMLVCGLAFIEYTRFKNTEMSGQIAETVIGLRTQSMDAANQSTLALIDDLALERLSGLGHSIQANLDSLFQHYQTNPNWFSAAGVKRISGMNQISMTLLPEIDLFVKNQTELVPLDQQIASTGDLIFRLTSMHALSEPMMKPVCWPANSRNCRNAPMI